MLKNLTNEQLLEYKKLFEKGLSISKRFESRKIHNQDNKFLYHIVRLLDECEQILEQQDLNLQRSKEILKSIRRGEWTYDQIHSWMMDKEKYLEKLYQDSTLPYCADENKIKLLLIDCIESHYGSIENCFKTNGWAINTLQNIDNLLNKYRSKLYN